MNQVSLVRDKSIFSEDYLPSQLSCRDRELSQLRSALSLITQRKAGRNVWLHGPPGTGKTAVSKLLLNELEDKNGVRCIYSNCWEIPTFSALLEKIIRDFRILGAERLSSPYRMERIEKHLQAKPLLIVLDEIDKPSPKERDSIIYNLCGMPNVTLICICNSRYFFLTLDSRVRSRLDPLLMEFKPYTQQDIVAILRQRAESGLENRVIKDRVLNKIARLSKGDARAAIQTLRHAALDAEQHQAPDIALQHLAKRNRAESDLKRKYLLAKLTDHHKLLYKFIQEQPGIMSGQLRKSYLMSCRQSRAQPVASRTFCLYLKTLSELGLIVYRRAVGVKGNVRTFRVL